MASFIAIFFLIFSFGCATPSLPIAVRLLGDPGSPKSVRSPEYLSAATNEISMALLNLNSVSTKLGFKPQAPFTLAHVDWEKTMVVNPVNRKEKRLILIKLTDGAVFSEIDGAVTSFTSVDTYLVGDSRNRTRVETNRFYGKVKYDWKPLAADFEKRLREEFKFPADFMERYEALSLWRMPELGAHGLARMRVHWYELPGSKERGLRDTRFEDLSIGWLVEFDLESGRPVSFGFHSSPQAQKFFTDAQAKQ